MFVVFRWGANCRFWSNLGCLDGKSLFLPIQVSLSTVHKEIFQKFALTLTTQKSSLRVSLSLSHTHISLC